VAESVPVEEELSPEAFYDGLASEYHLIFQNWWEGAVRHGEVIDRLLLARDVQPGAPLLDCTCGIGTQALPLALRGYQVLGTDISAAAVERARREADERDIALDFAVYDVRDVWRVASSRFDAVLACDNSLPHLLTDADLLAALRSIRTCLRAGGVFIASIRDYDELSRERPTGVTPVTYSSNGRRRIVGQVWQWSDRGETVLIRLFILQQDKDGWSCSLWATRYRALRRAEMDAALLAAGFDGVAWHAPRDSGYYQPIVTARAI
jgi:glycine/sarcosine N-methyltransferase